MSPAFRLFQPRCRFQRIRSRGRAVRRTVAPSSVPDGGNPPYSCRRAVFDLSRRTDWTELVALADEPARSIGVLLVERQTIPAIAPRDARKLRAQWSKGAGR